MKKYLPLTFIMSCLTLMVLAQPTVDGDLSDTDYVSIGTKANSNAGFGANIDVAEIVYYSDATNNKLYLGVQGKLDTGADNGIGVFINFSGLTGVAAGNDLGFSGAGHYMDGQGGGVDDNFQADFEVDYMLAMNPGNGTTSVFLDAAKVVGGNTTDFLGTATQTGGTATDADVFGTGSPSTYAFHNGGGANQGFEIVFDYSALGINAMMDIEVFTFVISATGFFSDVTVPGNVTGGNLGFNPNFGAVSGGNYHTGLSPLPVTWKDFEGKRMEDEVMLTWETASEINNSYFEVERSVDGLDWKPIHREEGQGFALSVSYYEFIDEAPQRGSNYYRIKQYDFDGKYSLSSVILIDFNKQGMAQFSPNPFVDYLQVEFTETTIPNRILIFNAFGQLVLEEVTQDQLLQLNTQDFIAGMYIVQLVDQHGEVSSTEKFLKL